MVHKIYSFNTVQCRIVCAVITYCVTIITCNVITLIYSRWTLVEIISSVTVSELPENEKSRLLQRDCATLCVIEYLAKSLKVI